MEPFEELIREIVEEEMDPKLTPLEIRHLLEHRLGYPRDGLHAREAEIREIAQRTPAPSVSLCPGEVFAWACAITLSTPLAYLHSPPADPLSWLFLLAKVYAGSFALQVCFGVFCGLLVRKVWRFPLSSQTNFRADEISALIFPAGGQAARVRRRRRSQIDHLILTCGDLEEGMSLIERLTGVAPAAGGFHPGIGTHNALLSLGGDCYLEIISPDPNQPTPPRARPFGLDTPCEAAPEGCGLRLAAFAVHPSGGVRGATLAGLAAAMQLAGQPAGPISGCSRTAPGGGAELRWRFSSPWEARGVKPFLIDWRGESDDGLPGAAAGSSPARTAPAGCSLVRLTCYAPDCKAAARVEDLLRSIGVEGLLPGEAGGAQVDVRVSERDVGEAYLEAVLDTPNGPVTLGA